MRVQAARPTSCPPMPRRPGRPPPEKNQSASRRARIAAAGCQSVRRSAPAFHQANMCTAAAPPARAPTAFQRPSFSAKAPEVAARALVATGGRPGEDNSGRSPFSPGSFDADAFVSPSCWKLKTCWAPCCRRRRSASTGGAPAPRRLKPRRCDPPASVPRRNRPRKIVVFRGRRRHPMSGARSAWGTSSPAAVLCRRTAAEGEATCGRENGMGRNPAGVFLGGERRRSDCGDPTRGPGPDKSGRRPGANVRGTGCGSLDPQ